MFSDEELWLAGYWPQEPDPSVSHYHLLLATFSVPVNYMTHGSKDRERWCLSKSNPSLGH